MPLIGQTGIVIGSGFDINEVFSVLQGGDFHHVGLEIAGQCDGAIIQEQADAACRGTELIDFPSVKELGHGFGLCGGDAGSGFAEKTFGAGVDRRLLGVKTHNIAQGEVHIHNVSAADELVHIGIGLFIAPDVERAVIHQNGGCLITAGHALDVGNIKFAVADNFRNRFQVRIVQDGFGSFILAETVAAPAIELSVFADGDDVVLTGCNKGNLCILDFFWDLFDIDAGGADGTDTPDVNLAVIGQTDREAGIAVDHLDIAGELTGDIHKVHGRRQVFLCGLGECIVILGHEMRCDKDDAEHHQNDKHRKHSKLAFHKTVENLASRADDQLGVVGHTVFKLNFLFLFLFQAEPFLFVLQTEDPADEPARKGTENVFFFIHFFASLLADAYTGINDAVAQVGNQIGEESDEGVNNLQEHDHIIVSCSRSVEEQKSHAFETEHRFKNHGTTDCAEETSNDDGNHGDQGIAPCMAVNDDFFRETLGACRADAVQIQSINHGCTGDTGNRGQGSESKADGRQCNVMQNIKHIAQSGIVGAWCFHTTDREPSKDRTEENNKNNIDNKTWGREADEREELRKAVKSAVLFYCAFDAQRNRDSQNSNLCNQADDE